MTKHGVVCKWSFDYKLEKKKKNECRAAIEEKLLYSYPVDFVETQQPQNTELSANGALIV